MTTLADIRDEARETIADLIIFPDSKLESFIKSAIKWYSGFGARLVTEQLVLTAAIQEYDLPDTLTELITVEYPSTQDPPQFAELVAFEGNKFVGYERFRMLYTNYCAIVGVSSSEHSTRYVLVFSDTIGPGENAKITYLARLPIPSIPTDTIPIPSSHEEALLAYVEFRAMKFLEQVEATSPTSNSALLLSQLGEEVRRSWRRCQEVKTEIMAELPPTVSTHSWDLLRQMDGGYRYGYY